jgi:hypothetical protein
MSRKNRLAILILVTSSICGRLYSQVDTLAWEHVINQAWNRPARLDTLANVHPRMLLDSGRVEVLKTKQTTTHQFIWEVVQAKAEQYLGKLPTGDYGNEDSTRKDGDAIPWLALAYLITEDTGYLEQAVNWMTTVCNYPQWDGDNNLAAGHCLLGVSLGYDWLYQAMTESQRLTVRDRLAYFAGRMAADQLSDSPRPRQYDRYLSNHCQVEYTGLAAAGFALFGDHPEAEDWIRKAYNIFNEAYEISGEDGSSTEGHQYFGLMTEFHMHFNKMAKEILGVDFYSKSTWLSNVGNFMLYSTLPGITSDNLTTSCAMGILEIIIGSAMVRPINCSILQANIGIPTFSGWHWKCSQEGSALPTVWGGRISCGMMTHCCLSHLTLSLRSVILRIPAGSPPAAHGMIAMRL